MGSLFSFQLVKLYFEVGGGASGLEEVKDTLGLTLSSGESQEDNR